MARMGDRRDVSTVLGKTDRKKPLGRHRHRLEETLQLFFKQTDRLARTGLIWLTTGTRSGLS
jgi:hypothetical protein